MANTTAASIRRYIDIYFGWQLLKLRYDGVVAGEALGVVSGDLQGPLLLVIRQVRPGLLGRGHSHSQSRWQNSRPRLAYKDVTCPQGQPNFSFL